MKDTIMLPVLLFAIVAVPFAAGEELRCERIMVGACQNLVYDMTIASAPETALQYLSPGTPSANAGANTTATGTIRTWLDAERLVSFYNCGHTGLAKRHTTINRAFNQPENLCRHTAITCRILLTPLHTDLF